MRGNRPTVKETQKYTMIDQQIGMHTDRMTDKKRDIHAKLK